jgi:ETC complex I subunit conserved region.|tara:strand:+ start:482 stop:763 length:282 start_codon:yes stop_codon:yes gene_type:complete
MKKAKIYIPTKTSMQSGRGKQKKWLLEFYTNESRQNHLMDWQTSTDTLSEVKLAFPSKEQAIKYATKNNIKYKIIEPKKRKITIKSYADNFLD